MRLRARGAGGAAVDAIPERLVAGLFTVDAAEGAPRGTLVPGVAALDDGRFVGAGVSDADARALGQVVASLDDDTPWSEWTAASHVVASFDGSVTLTDLERSLDANLGALQDVCRSPRMLLRHDEERVAVSRARRTSSRTIADLVARPGDWEHRTLRSIRPSRVLSVVPDDDWDLYENRVAARLVDRLLALLAQRIEELGSIRALLDEGHDFSDETRGSHWRSRRIAQTWSRVEAGDSLRAQVAATHRKVGALADAVRALASSPLYARIPRGHRVDDTLRPTNILVNDRSYQKVAELWRLAASVRAARAPSREELVRRRREVSARFDVFAAMLVLQALASFGYAPDGDARFVDGAMRLRSARGELSVRREADGSVSIAQGHRALAVVALPVEASADAASMWNALRATRSCDTVYLLYGRPDTALTHMGIDDSLRRALAGWSWPRVLVVSPWSLDAVERVARVIGAWDAGTRLERFPPRVSWKERAPEAVRAWARISNGWLVAVRPPGAAERRAVEEDIRQREASAARARNGTRDGREDPSVGALRELVERAEQVRWLARCPVCERYGVQFDDRWQEGAGPEQQTVWCRCDGCKASWGLRACGACRRRFEALDPGVNLPCPDDVAMIDRTYGRDLWCEPVEGDGGRREFRCPRCSGA